MASSVVVTKFGGYDCLQIQKMPVPSCGNEDVIVKVKACGLNFADIYLRQGIFPMSNFPKPPFVPGLECAGEIETVGENVKHLKKGDRVICYSFSCGLMSDTVCIPACQCYVMPTNMSFEEGATITINYCTAYFALFGLGGLKSGDVVFIHSVAGGVGFAVIQLARTIPNVEVCGTASQHKHQAALDSGVKHVFTYDNYREELKKKYPLGVDVFIDIFSGKDFSDAVKFLRPTGKLIHIGAMNVVTGEHRSFGALFRVWWGLKKFSPLDLITSNIAVSGLGLSTLCNQDPQRFNNAMKVLLDMYTHGIIKPQIDSVWNINEIQKATQRLANRENIGKVILLPYEKND